MLVLACPTPIATAFCLIGSGCDRAARNWLIAHFVGALAAHFQIPRLQVANALLGELTLA